MIENWKLERYVGVVKYRLHTHEWLVYYYEVVAMYYDSRYYWIRPLITIDVNFKMNMKNWTRRCCCSGLAGLFHFGKIHSNHTFVEAQEQSWDCCIKKNPTLVNVIESYHTYNCIHIHALRSSYNCCHWWYCSNMKGSHVSVHNNNIYSCIDMKRPYEM
jgi:hypothetical protein